eukprot:5967210-Amphidinium_carterae.1
MDTPLCCQPALSALPSFDSPGVVPPDHAVAASLSAFPPGDPAWPFPPLLASSLELVFALSFTSVPAVYGHVSHLPHMALHLSSYD